VDRQVISGMMAASFVAMFLIPVLFYPVEKYSGRKPHPKKTERPALAPAEALAPPH
jgi:hydrophobic/amphiphilic exporter-1 (mainly G- bacteria), HAE1 family